MNVSAANPKEFEEKSKALGTAQGILIPTLPHFDPFVSTVGAVMTVGNLIADAAGYVVLTQVCARICC